MEKEIKDKKKGSGFLIGLLIVVVVSLAMFIVYDKVLKNDNEEEKTKEVLDEKPKDEIEEPQPEEVKLDKEEVNEKLKDFEFAYNYTFGELVLPSNMVYDQELLVGNKQRMFDFVWIYTNLLKIDNVIYSKDVSGQEVDGAYAVEINAYKELYEKIFSEEFDGNYKVSNKYDFELSNNYIYGGLYTGVGIDSIVLKIKSCDKQLDTYKVVIDVLYFDIDNELDLMNELSKSDTTEYDDEYVFYRLNLDVVLNDDIYMIDSFKAVRK